MRSEPLLSGYGSGEVKTTRLSTRRNTFNRTPHRDYMLGYKHLLSKVYRITHSEDKATPRTDRFFSEIRMIAEDPSLRIEKPLNLKNGC